MKTAARLILASLLALILVPVVSARRVNLTTPTGTILTINAGVPFRLSTKPQTWADRWMVQAIVNPNTGTPNSGIIYIMTGVAPSATCSATNAAQLTAELGAGSSNQPGQSFTDPPGEPWSDRSRRGGP